MSELFIFLSLVLGAVLIAVWDRYASLRRQAYIRSFAFPRGLFNRLMARHPQLTLKDCQLVARGLRQFFLAYLNSRRKFVSMPSQVADDLWHEFILYTKTYQSFCRTAFGQFLHHTPATVLGSERQNNAGLRRCWWYACLDENINPRAPTRLPLLFALDAKLDIPNGFRYVADCQSLRKQADDHSRGIVHCGGDFSNADVDGCTDGLGDGDGDGGSGCGGGCGGD